MARTTDESTLNDFDINEIVKIGGSMQGHSSEMEMINEKSIEVYPMTPNKGHQEPMSACLPLATTKRKKVKIDKNSIEYKIQKLDRKMT